MSNTLSLRFRHTQGDVGPLKFGSDTSVLGVKERLVTEWPTSELLARQSCPALNLDNRGL